MSDLRERLRVLLARSTVHHTRQRSLLSHKNPQSPRRSGSLGGLSFFSSLALRADSAGSLCLADRRYDGPQPVCLTTSPPRRRARLAALLANVDSVSSESGHGFRLGRRRHVDIRRRECLRLGRQPRRPPHRLRLLRLPRLLLVRATAHRRHTSVQSVQRRRVSECLLRPPWLIQRNATSITNG